MCYGIPDRRFVTQDSKARTLIPDLLARIPDPYTLQVGLSNMHGLRQAYAQQRYQELTGWPALAAGGPKAEQLTPEQKIEDQKARMAISQELGHVRTQILVVYCGK